VQPGVIIPLLFIPLILIMIRVLLLVPIPRIPPPTCPAPTPPPTKPPHNHPVFVDESKKANNSPEQAQNPIQPINGHAPSPQNPPPSDIDELWLTIQGKARVESEKEPTLASHFYSLVISHRYGMLIIKILAHL
jgi:hypothetical protein